MDYSNQEDSQRLDLLLESRLDLLLDSQLESLLELRLDFRLDSLLHPRWDKLICRSMELTLSAQQHPNCRD